MPPNHQKRIASLGCLPKIYGALKKAIAYIDAHYKEKIPLSTLAATAGMGTSTFRRVFTKLLSISPGEYISTIRINHARKLLAKTSLTVEQIADACGFFDQSHMTKLFKSLRRMTPGEYRRRHKTRGS